MWWVFGVVAVVVALATYLTWLAARVDRLHARAAGANRALDAQLRRRAVAVHDLAGRSAATWGDDALAVRRSARLALDAAPPDRESAENDLTRGLRALSPVSDTDRDELDGLNRRVTLARQVHTDLVRDALAVRRQRVVRLLRLARKHPRPEYFDIDDPTMAAPPGHGAAEVADAAEVPAEPAVVPAAGL